MRTENKGNCLFSVISGLRDSAQAPSYAVLIDQKYKQKIKTLVKPMLYLFLFCISSMSCTTRKCHLAILSFNNELREKITVKLYGIGKKDIDADSAAIFKVRPYQAYRYDVLDYRSKVILISSKDSADACESKGVNIK